jgi:predicted RNA-binding protein Jag
VEQFSTYLKCDAQNRLANVTYKITIVIEEQKMTSDALNQTAHYLSEALNRMGFDHTVECHLDKLKLFSKLTRHSLS